MFVAAGFAEAQPGNDLNVHQWVKQWYTYTIEILCVFEVAQLCPALCNPMDYSQQGSSAHGILQARILEWVGIPFSRGSSQPRSPVSPALAGGFFAIETPGKPKGNPVAAVQSLSHV